MRTELVFIRRVYPLINVFPGLVDDLLAFELGLHDLYVQHHDVVCQLQDVRRLEKALFVGVWFLFLE
jgi:hypothetical protein